VRFFSPLSVPFLILLSNLLKGTPFPLAKAHVDDSLKRGHAKITDFGDLLSGLKGSKKRAGVNRMNFLSSEIPCCKPGLSESDLIEWHIGSSSKNLFLIPGGLPMTDQVNLCHGSPSCQAVEKRPSAALLLPASRSFVVAAYIKYASLLRISGALHLGIFEQPERNHFSSGC
jgi:hypothetical protein